MVVIDTDHMTFLHRAESVEGSRLKLRLSGVAFAGVSTTIVSFEEQTRGWLSYMARAAYR